MHHYVIRMQTQQHVRKNGVVKHSILSPVLMLLLACRAGAPRRRVIVIVLALLPSIMSRSTIMNMSMRGICDSQGARVPTHGQAFAFRYPHESTEERSFGQIVLRGIIR